MINFPSSHAALNLAVIYEVKTIKPFLNLPLKDFVTIKSNKGKRHIIYYLTSDDFLLVVYSFDTNNVERVCKKV